MTIRLVENLSGVSVGTWKAVVKFEEAQVAIMERKRAARKKTMQTTAITGVWPCNRCP